MHPQFFFIVDTHTRMHTCTYTPCAVLRSWGWAFMLPALVGCWASMRQTGEVVDVRAAQALLRLCSWESIARSLDADLSFLVGVFDAGMPRMALLCSRKEGDG